MSDSENALSVCNGGSHYLYDSSSKKYVNVGACEDHHEPEHDAPLAPQKQVVNAAQNALHTATGKPQKGGPYMDPVSATAISDVFKGKR